MKKLSVLMVALCAACGSSTSSSTTGSGTLSGNVGGMGFTIADAAFSVVANSNVLNIVLSETAGICADAQLAASNPNAPAAQASATTSGGVVLLSVGGFTAYNPNTFTVDNNVVKAEYAALQNTNFVLANATSGNVVVSAASTSKITGTYNLIFGADSNATVSGTFSAGNCNADLGALTSH